MLGREEKRSAEKKYDQQRRCMLRREEQCSAEKKYTRQSRKKRLKEEKMLSIEDIHVCSAEKTGTKQRRKHRCSAPMCKSENHLTCLPPQIITLPFNFPTLWPTLSRPSRARGMITISQTYLQIGFSMHAHLEIVGYYFMSSNNAWLSKMKPQK